MAKSGWSWPRSPPRKLLAAHVNDLEIRLRSGKTFNGKSSASLITWKQFPASASTERKNFSSTLEEKALVGSIYRAILLPLMETRHLETHRGKIDRGNFLMRDISRFEFNLIDQEISISIENSFTNLNLQVESSYIIFWITLLYKLCNIDSRECCCSTGNPVTNTKTSAKSWRGLETDRQRWGTT